MRTKRIDSGLIVCMVAILILSSPCANLMASEEKYPSKTINWCIWSGVGGGTDIFSRTVAMPIRKKLGVPIIIRTMSGGVGARMMNYMLEQPRDGYTIGSFTPAGLGSIARHITDAKVSDLVGIARGCYDPMTLAVATNSRFKTIQDIVNFGKANPKKVKIAGVHMAGIDHITVYDFSKRAGFESVYVPYKGGGEALISLLNGTADAAVLNPSELAGQYEAGKIKPVVMLTEKRLKDYPDVPTAKELGWAVEQATWRGTFLMRGAPQHVVETLRKTFMDAMDTKIYRDYLRNNSMGPESIMTGEAFEVFLKKQYPVWDQFMKEMGYKK